MGGIVWRMSLRRGLVGGSRPWMYVLVAVGAVRLLRRISGSVPEKVFTEELKPGEALIITHYADQTLGDVR